MLLSVLSLLAAGVMEGGVFKPTTIGTPQGGVISPLLSNVYLHTVLDEWMEKEIAPRLRGKMKMVRFADDFVIVFEKEEDALRVKEVLPKRFARFGLEIHPEKTRLVDFRHPWEQKKKPETFDFLGFTHYWGKTRKGGYAVKKQTASKKLRKGLRSIHEWSKKNCHRDMAWQHAKLCEKLQGHYAYYGVTGNYAKIAGFRYYALRVWRYWLNRRSRKHDGMPWSRFSKLLEGKYAIPPPHIVHTWKRNMQTCLSF